MEVVSTQRATINTLRVVSHDCVDESLKLFSNTGATVRLPKNHSDDFWWDRDGLFILKNCSEQECTVDIEVLKCTGDLLVMRSSHQSARTYRSGTSVKRLVKPGESLTFRSNDAQGKGATNL